VSEWTVCAAVFGELWRRTEVKDGQLRHEEASRRRLGAVSRSRSTGTCRRRTMPRQTLLTVSLDIHQLVAGLTPYRYLIHN